MVGEGDDLESTEGDNNFFGDMAKTARGDFNTGEEELIGES